MQKGTITELLHVYIFFIMPISINKNNSIIQVIGASSLGTLIEWYDFYIFGSLSGIISKHLFPDDSGVSALISTLAIFAAGFIVRPFGALFFGRLGDIVGRKHTFLLTLILMGGSTFFIGCIPSYSQIGYAAPIIALILRLIQGLALGGEYGGAATYIAEYAPLGKRGFYTSWIQTTATLGLFLSLGIIVFTRSTLGELTFYEWGWRIPFLISILLVIVSVYIRLKMNESPLFSKLKSEGKISTNPLKESFQNKMNFKMVLLALFGATMGQGVIWYTGQFYAQSFLENTVLLEFNEVRYIMIWAILLGTPFFILFGSWSDRVGRKWIMLSGMLLGIISYRSIYQTFLDKTDFASFQSTTLVSSTQPILKKIPLKGTTDSILITSLSKTLSDGSTFKEIKKDTLYSNAKIQMNPSIPICTDKTLSQSTFIWFVFLVFIQIIFVTMVYGPIAAFLVELFPTQIRYTSMSLPYHIGNGVFGGLVPFIATLIVSYPGADKLSGLWYPIGVACLSLIIGTLYINNNNKKYE